MFSFSVRRATTRRLSFVVCLLTCGAAPLLKATAAPNAPVYPEPDAALPTRGEVIAVPADAGPGLIGIAGDGQRTLQKMTGRQFAVTPTYNGPGLWLIRFNSPAAPADAVKQLGTLGREPFVIRTVGDHIIVVANSDDGLQHGLYYYLDQLGARWYYPNENWTIIPKRENIDLKFNKLVAPAFKARSFFGTGGFGRAGVNRHTDLTDKLPGQWALWQLRNRFGGEFALRGHAGESFNLRHKAILLANPTYLAEIGGKNVPYALGTKPNVGNPDLVKLYVADRLTEYRNNRKTMQDSPHSFAVSVEPSDGGGYSTTGPAMAIGNGSPSDQTFYLANETAKALIKEFPDGRVSLLAYGEHAAVPSFPIEPNVFVAVVPYGFQRTGLSPEDLIKAWGEKVTEMGMYDYWSIPDWAQDQPNLNYLVTPAERIRFWHKNKVVSYSSESTYSAGALGVAWYIAGRLMWDPQADVKPMVEEFYTQAFGPARKPMQRMMERWTNYFLLTDHELGMSYVDLLEARKLAANDPAVMARLDDYAGYLHYLRLLHEFQHSESAPARETAAGQLLEHMWNIYDTAMVHTFRMTQLVTQRYFNDPELVKLYSNNKEAEGWTRIKPLTHDDYEALLADGAAKYKPLDFDQTSYGGPLVLADPTLKPLPADTEGINFNFINDMELTMLVPAGMKSLPLYISSTKALTLKQRDMEGNALKNYIVPAGTHEPTEIIFAKPGLHRLYIQCQKTDFNIIIPSKLPLIMGGFFNSQGRPIRRIYFRVPRGQKTIAMHNPYTLVPMFYNSKGELVLPRPENAGPGIVLVDVPEGEDGKIWALGNVRSPVPFSMMNVPHCFAFWPQTLLTPQDAVK